MREVSRYRRVVAWVDGSAEAAYAADWAARHAAARALPLHLLCIPRLALPVGASGAHEAAYAGFTPDESAVSDAARAIEDASHLRARYPNLAVSEQLVRHGCHQPVPRLLDHGDILVTSPGGYLDLVGQAELEEHAAARVPAPTVFVPDSAASMSTSTSTSSERRVLLLTGSRFFPTAASFAFAAAADLGGPLDVVRFPAAYDDDYGFRPDSGPHCVGPHLRAEVAALRGRFLGVSGDFHTLGARPWPALHAMTSAAHLAVVGVGPGCGVDVRALYDLGTCPIAIVPES